MSLTDYLHGVRWIQDPSVPSTILFTRTSVIGLVGTAFTPGLVDGGGGTNKLTLVNSARKAAELFGTVGGGYTIPEAIAAINSQNVGLMLVVNVFDPTNSDMYTDVADESVTLTSEGVANLASTHVWNVVVENQAGDTTYVLDTDYTVDLFKGKITRIADGDIAAGATLTVSYRKADFTGITATEIVGEVDSSGVRSGIQALETGFMQFGFDAKILIAPRYSHDPLVTAALAALADRVRGIALVDAPFGASVTDAIEGRNATTGTVKNFMVNNKRLDLCFPFVKGVTGQFEPMSSYRAGIYAQTDAKLGYWYSPSNKPINGITELSADVTSSHIDPTTDVQLLNASGISTIFGQLPRDTFGAGLRAWGNRNSTFPSDTTTYSFINQIRIEDTLSFSVMLAILRFIDRPISTALVEEIAATVNAFIRVQKNLGALVDGKCWYDPDDNPAEEIANGHLVFRVDFIGPPPLEKITFRSSHNINYLNQIGVTSQQAQSQLAVLGV